MQGVLLYVGSGVIVLWGIGHLVPTRSVVSGFGDVSRDNRRIITMEWLAEGLTLCFLGVLVSLMAATFGPDSAVTQTVARACAAMLLVLAFVSSLTGARTKIVPMRLCPFIKSSVAVVFIVATLM